MMSDDENRPYRKNLTTKGLIYLGGQELEVSVKNLSLTGVMAELADNPEINNIGDIFQSISLSPTIDIYLPEMHLAGEAEVVRADNRDGHIYLALEFRNVTYDIDNMLYKRKAYRKNITAPGQIVFNDTKYKFNTKNVSVEGLMIHLEENVTVEVGTITIFDFKRLHLRGEIRVAWVDYSSDGSTFMGLQYIHMEKAHISGIPRFSPDALEKPDLTN